MKALIALLLVVVLFGCKKKHDVKKECRIAHITKNGNQTYDFAYGSDGKLSSMLLLPTNESTAYSYDGNKTTVTVNKNGKFQYRMLIENNASGLARSVLVEKNLTGTDWFRQTFFYEGNRVVTNIMDDVAEDTAKVEYIWENGNPAVVIIDGDVNQHKYYTEKKAQPGDWRYIQQLISGYRIYEYRNLLQMTVVPVSGYTIYYTYQFDGEGHIVEATATEPQGTTTFKLAYECDY